MTGHYFDPENEPPTYEEEEKHYRVAVKKAEANIRVFEETEEWVSRLDDEILADAKGSKSIAAMNRDKSPARKRAIDKCQFAMQKAVMYSTYANAIRPV